MAQLPNVKKRVIVHFFDANYVVGINGWNKQLPALQTYHGYQFNSWLYAGAGLTLDWVTNSSRHDTSSANLFLDLRSDLLRKKVSPFVDVKCGYTILGVQGLYFNPNIGCRISLNNRNGINISVGYVSRYRPQAHIGTNGYHYYSHIRSDAVMVSIGFDL